MVGRCNGSRAIHFLSACCITITTMATPLTWPSMDGGVAALLNQPTAAASRANIGASSTGLPVDLSSEKTYSPMEVGERFAVAGRTLDLIPKELFEFYEFHEWRNAVAVLSGAFPSEWTSIIEVLTAFRILRSDIGELGEKGGGKSKVAIRMDRMFREREWRPQEFETSIVVRTAEATQTIESPTHEVDCFKGKVALELEQQNRIL